MRGDAVASGLVGMREAGSIARRSPETIRRWVWSGRLEAERHGNRLLVARNDVLRLAGAVGQTMQDAPETLLEWIDATEELRRGRRGASSSDLVLDDRGERSDAGR